MRKIRIKSFSTSPTNCLNYGNSVVSMITHYVTSVCPCILSRYSVLIPHELNVVFQVFLSTHFKSSIIQFSHIFLKHQKWIIGLFKKSFYPIFYYGCLNVYFPLDFVWLFNCSCLMCFSNSIDFSLHPHIK